MRAPRRELTTPEIEAAQTIAELWREKQNAHKASTGKRLSQADASYDLGFTSPSAFSQYLNGYIALNVQRLLNFAAYFNVKPDAIYPDLAATIGRHHYYLDGYKNKLVLVNDSNSNYEHPPSEALMVKATGCLFDVITLDVAKQRGAQWTAQTIIKLHDLFQDPASEKLNKETILRLI